MIYEVWVVVKVWRGIPDEVKLYSNEQEARSYETSIRKSLAPEDEIGVFCATLPANGVTE